MKRTVAFLFYLGFVAALCSICFLRPVADDFDRYIYEALVRGRYQSVQQIYPILKHESVRTESSSILDSPEHLGQLEPLYAIRPLYVRTIEAVAHAGAPIQRAITLVSALSLLGIGMVLFGWTRRPLYCALLMATPAIVVLGRIGTPDALSSLVLLSSAWALVRQRIFFGVVLLLVSIWVRTDNLLFVLMALLWLAAAGKLSLSQSAIFGAVAGASVLFINHFAGSYGWSVMIRYSFISGKSPAEVPAGLNWREYIGVLIHAIEGIGGQELALWTLLGIAAWRWLPRSFVSRQLLVPVALAAVARFLLFPTPEDRYFSWAYLIVGACFIEAMGNGRPVSGASG